MALLSSPSPVITEFCAAHLNLHVCWPWFCTVNKPSGAVSRVLHCIGQEELLVHISGQGRCLHESLKVPAKSKRWPLFFVWILNSDCLQSGLK